MVGNPNEACSAACELRYKSLGNECWSTFHLNYRWQKMQQLCDSNNDYEINGWFTAAPGTGTTTGYSGVSAGSVLTSSASTVGTGVVGMVLGTVGMLLL